MNNEKMPESEAVSERPLYGGAALEGNNMLARRGDEKFIAGKERRFSDEQLIDPTKYGGARAVLARAMKRRESGQFEGVADNWLERTNTTFENANAEKKAQLQTKLGLEMKTTLSMVAMQKMLREQMNNANTEAVEEIEEVANNESEPAA